MSQHGGGNLNVISQIKEKVLRTVLSDEICMKLVLNQPVVPLPALDARYTQVMPWRGFPQTQTETKSFVSFEVGVSGPVNSAAREYTLAIYVMCHSSLMPIDDRIGRILGIDDRGTRVDLIADRLDYLINGQTDMGFGKVEIQSSTPFEPIDGYIGRNLVYTITGWNRYGDKL